MNVWHDINPKRITPQDFLAIIEISKGSKNKYELDKESGILILDRILYTSTHYPANYGFIPKTLADDGDPLDVLVLCNEPINPMVLVQCYPIGVITMVDNGKNDEKIIAIPFEDPTFNSYRSIEALPQHIFQEMQHFFTVYKQLENKCTAVNEVMGQKAAVEVIAQCIENYQKKYGTEKAAEKRTEAEKAVEKGTAKAAEKASSKTAEKKTAKTATESTAKTEKSAAKTEKPTAKKTAAKKASKGTNK